MKISTWNNHAYEEREILPLFLLLLQFLSHEKEKSLS